MTAVSMTNKWLESLKLGADHPEYTDAVSPGLRLRVGQKRMTWTLVLRSNGSRRRIPLGHYPKVSLKEARRRAAELSEDADAPAAANPSQSIGTLRDLFELTITEMEREGKISARDYRATLIDSPNSALNIIGRDAAGNDLPANAITPDDVTRWLRAFVQRGAGTGHPRAYLSAAFNRGLSADYDPRNPNPERRFALTQNPVAVVGGRPTGKARSRILSLEELKYFYQNFQGRRVSAQMQILMKLIMTMGAVRISEIVRAEKAWRDVRNFDLKTEQWLSLPKTKNGHAHDLPIPASALPLFEAATLISHDRSPYLFCGDRDPQMPQTLNSVSKAVRRWNEDQMDWQPFQPRDLRRTIKTLLIERNPALNRDWIDIWHNHGRAADVARKHYDFAEYREAKIAVAAAIDDLMQDVTKK